MEELERDGATDEIFLAAERSWNRAMEAIMRMDGEIYCLLLMMSLQRAKLGSMLGKRSLRRWWIIEEIDQP